MAREKTKMYLVELKFKSGMKLVNVVPGLGICNWKNKIPVVAQNKKEARSEIYKILHFTGEPYKIINIELIQDNLLVNKDEEKKKDKPKKKKKKSKSIVLYMP